MLKTNQNLGLINLALVSSALARCARRITDQASTTEMPAINFEIDIENAFSLRKK